MLYVLEINVRTYCMLYVLELNVRTYCMFVRPCTKIVPNIVYRLILAVFVVYGEWVNLAIVSAWHLVL